MPLVMSSMLMNQYKYRSKVFLSRNTHNARLHIDRLMKMLCPEAYIKEPNSVCPGGGMVEDSLIQYSR